jgi:hypothetical protein
MMTAMVLNPVTHNWCSSKPHRLQCGTNHHPMASMETHGEEESHYGLIFYSRKVMVGGRSMAIVNLGDSPTCTCIRSSPTTGEVSTFNHTIACNGLAECQSCSCISSHGDEGVLKYEH